MHQIRSIGSIIVAAATGFFAKEAAAQSFTATRIDGRPTGYALDSGGFDPIVDLATFTAVGAAGEGDNINGPSLVRLPDWLPADKRVHPDANYYLYFAHHAKTSIRLAWASSLTGVWTLFNYGTSTDRAWGPGGLNTGAQTSGSGVLDLNIGNLQLINFDGPGGFAVGNHIASPDIFTIPAHRFASTRAAYLSCRARAVTRMHQTRKPMGTITPSRDLHESPRRLRILRKLRRAFFVPSELEDPNGWIKLRPEAQMIATKITCWGDLHEIRTLVFAREDEMDTFGERLIHAAEPIRAFRLMTSRNPARARQPQGDCIVKP